MPKTNIYIHTFGCRLNKSETAVIENSLIKEGFSLTNTPAKASVAVINTCTVTEGGDADTRKLVNKLVRSNPKIMIALIGCQAQIQKGLLSKLPNIYWIIGNEKKMELAKILTESLAIGRQGKPHIITPTIERKSFTLPEAAIDRKHTRANVKIQDGCDDFCSFCDIPYARGRARSRVFDDIIKEVRILAQAGHKEVVLTGINIGKYNYLSKDIADVIISLKKVSGIKRIRISSIEPTTVSAKLLKLFERPGKLCRHLHIPLQSASNTILKIMNRNHTVEDFDKLTRKIKKINPNICIGTDVVVGFPGETDALFEETYQYLKSSIIDHFHIFSYSKRNLAKSRNIPDIHNISPEIIKSRSQRLRTLAAQKKESFTKTLLETKQRILFEEMKDGYWKGLSDHFVPVYVKLKKNIKNQLLPVLTSNYEKGKVIGKILETS